MRDGKRRHRRERDGVIRQLDVDSAVEPQVSVAGVERKHQTKQKVKQRQQQQKKKRGLSTVLCCAGGGGSSRTIESVGSNSPSLSPTFGTMHRGDRPNALLSSQTIRHDSHQQHQLQQEEDDQAEQGTPLPPSGERIVKFVLPTPSPGDNGSRAAWQVHVQAASASARGEAWWLELAGE